MAGVLASPLGILDEESIQQQSQPRDLISSPPIIESAPALDPNRALWAGTLMDIGNIFAGNGSTGNGMRMYLGARNAIDRQKRQKELDKQPVKYMQGADGIYAIYKDGSSKLMDGIPMPEQQRKILQGADGYNYYQDSGERVLPGVQAAPKDRPVIKGADGYQYYQDTGERVLPGITAAPNAGSVPADVRTFEYYQNLTPEQQQAFMEVKRGDQSYLNPLQEAQLAEIEREAESAVNEKEGKHKVVLNAIGTTRNLIKEITADENLGDVLGWVDGRIPGIGQSEADLVARIDRFKSQIQLELVEKLKGTGPITENEQKILMLAGGIDRVQSPEAFKQVLQELDEFLRVREENITRTPKPGAPSDQVPGQSSSTPTNDPLGLFN